MRKGIGATVSAGVASRGSASRLTCDVKRYVGSRYPGSYHVLGVGFDSGLPFAIAALARSVGAQFVHGQRCGNIGVSKSAQSRAVPALFSGGRLLGCVPNLNDPRMCSASGAGPSGAVDGNLRVRQFPFPQDAASVAYTLVEKWLQSAAVFGRRAALPEQFAYAVGRPLRFALCGFRGERLFGLCPRPLA